MGGSAQPVLCWSILGVVNNKRYCSYLVNAQASSTRTDIITKEFKVLRWAPPPVCLPSAYLMSPCDQLSQAFPFIFVYFKLSKTGGGERPGSKAIVIARDACELTIRRLLHTAVFHPLQTALHQLWQQPSFQQSQRKLQRWRVWQ